MICVCIDSKEIPNETQSAGEAFLFCRYEVYSVASEFIYFYTLPVVTVPGIWVGICSRFEFVGKFLVFVYVASYRYLQSPYQSCTT